MNTYGRKISGLELSDVMADGERVPIKSLLWHKIAKLGFDKRKVTVVGMEGSKMVFYAQSDDKARYLLEFCKSIHQQVMALQADINEARNVEMKGIYIDFFCLICYFFGATCYLTKILNASSLCFCVLHKLNNN